MPWRPSEPGEVPTLGYAALDWIVENLAMPDRLEYEPFDPYEEQVEFLLRFYELDPRTCRRRYRRAVLSRSRGWGKSPFAAALSWLEALGPVVPAGWDAHGRPVGKAWATVRTPLVQIAAVSEGQTANTWSALLEMAAGPVVDNHPGTEALDTFVNLPTGRIEPITSSASTAKGARSVFVVADQTEEWTRSNGGHRLFERIKNNAAKVAGSFVETPNAYVPGEDSVAERSAAAWVAMREGRARERGLYVDHREAPPETELDDRDSLIAGLRVAYGDASGHADGCVLHHPPCPAGHVDLDVLVGTIWDPSSDVQVSRADFLNQITHASDAWLSQPEWAARSAVEVVVEPDDRVVLGFDGSRRRKRGVTDATALVGCRVSDGHVFLVGCWEQPDGPAGQDWQVPALEVDAVVREAFAAWDVVGLYADPALWESYIAQWEAAFSDRLLVRSSRDHPIEWWMGGGRGMQTSRAIDAFHQAVVEGEMTHDGSSVLTRHVLNARRRPGRSGMQIAKEHPDSPRKIDAAVSAVLAWQCRLDALSRIDLLPAPRPRSRRIRRF